MTQHQTETPDRRSLRSPRPWRWKTLLCALLLVVMTHPWWLRAIGEFLVAEKPVPTADVAIVLGGDHRLQRATELLTTGMVSQVWLVEREPSYAEEAGILPTSHALELRELISLGAQESQIRVLNGRAKEYDDAAHIVADELRQSPDTTVIILCHRPHGRNVRLVFSELLGKSLASHFTVLGLPDDEFDEQNWWRSRSGWKETFTAISDLAFTLVIGVEQPQGRAEWDPDAYERQLVSEYGESACSGE